MTNGDGGAVSSHDLLDEPSRKRHWGRWSLGCLLVVVVVIVAVVVVFIELQPVPAPLVLPKAPAKVPVGALEGTWLVGPGSEAGFRIKETALFFSNDVVGRTSAVSGSFVVSGGWVSSATFRIDLRSVEVGGKVQVEFARSLATDEYPDASFRLTRPLALSPAFASGASFTTTATGVLTIHGASHSSTFAVSGRRDGRVLQVAGSVPVVLSAWGITRPAGYGPLGSLADHGVVEFFLVLDR